MVSTVRRQGTGDRPIPVSPPTTTSQESEGSDACEHSRDSGSISSLGEPEAGDSRALGERCVIRHIGDSTAKLCDTDCEWVTSPLFARDRYSPVGLFCP